MRAPRRSLVVVVAGAGLILGGTYLPVRINVGPESRQGPVTKARPAPVTQTLLICPGPEALGVEGLRDSRAQTVWATAAAAPLAALPSGFAPGRGAGSLRISGLPVGGRWAAPVALRGRVVSSPSSTARSALITGAGALAPGTVARQWSWTTRGERRGLVTAACMPAAASSWLIGGGADPGRQERLVLTNPGPKPVTVDLTVLGVEGPIGSPNGHEVVVGGHARKVVLLDAIAGSERSPVVHVAADGGEVAATLSDSWLDGVVSRGGDDVVSVVAPAREQVITGVPIFGRAILRVAVPGDSEAVVQSRVLTAGGPRALPAKGVVRVAGHSTRDIDLGSLSPGVYAVQVRADVPVVAAAMVERRRAARAPSDLAWSVASAPIKALAGTTLPASAVKGVIHRLDLAATSDPASVWVTTVGAHGRVSRRSVVLRADSVTALPLSGATSVWVTPRAGQVRAAVRTIVVGKGGTLLSQAPLADLRLTTTTSPLHQLAD